MQAAVRRMPTRTDTMRTVQRTPAARLHAGSMGSAMAADARVLRVHRQAVHLLVGTANQELVSACHYCLLPAAACSRSCRSRPWRARGSSLYGHAPASSAPLPPALLLLLPGGLLLQPSCAAVLLRAAG